MAGLTIEKFEGGTGWMLTQYDDQIDWGKSKCSRQEFANDHDKYKEALAWTDGATPIRIYFHFPTRSELSMSYREAGADLGGKARLAVKIEQGEDALDVMTEKDIMDTLAAAVELARICIDRVVHLDSWPGDEKAHEPLGRLRRLRADVLPELVLEDVGMYILQQASLKRTVGEPSASRAGGPSKQSDASTQTDATDQMDAERTRRREQPGGATE